MFRKLFIAAALAAVAALPAGAAPVTPAQVVAQSLLMPGVSYQRAVEFTPHGPVVLDVVTAPRPDGSLYTLTPVLSNNAVVATEKLTDMEKDLSTTATVVGVNGDFFVADPGKPNGILMRGGALDTAPISSRSSLGIGNDGTLTVAQVSFDGTWRGNGQRRQFDLNAPPVKGHTTLYTSSWGPETPAESGVAVDVLPAIPRARAQSRRHRRRLAGCDRWAGSDPAGRRRARRAREPGAHLTAEAPAGTTIELRPTLTPSWNGMSERNRRRPAARRERQAGLPRQRVLRRSRAQPACRAERGCAAERRPHPARDRRRRRLVVQRRDDELRARRRARAARCAHGHGARYRHIGGDGIRRHAAYARDRAADRGCAHVVVQRRVRAPLVSTTLSPNGDGVDDVQTFTYKLVRPSQVTATVSGPNNATLTLAQDTEQPGVHTLQWDGNGAAEGAWHFSVTAVDDAGRTTTADRQFALNDTLGVAAGDDDRQRSDRGVPARPRRDRDRDRREGQRDRRRDLLSKKLDPGSQSVTWTGRPGSGYRVRVVAANSIGKATLLSPLTSRHS